MRTVVVINLGSFLFPQIFQISLNKSKFSFHTRKLTSILTIFCLNKTLFTHFDFKFVSSIFVTKNSKLLNFLLGLRELTKRKSMSKVGIWLLKVTLEINLKIEHLWFVIKSFCCIIFIYFPKKIGGGGESHDLLVSDNDVTIFPLLVDS